MLYAAHAASSRPSFGGGSRHEPPGHPLAESRWGQRIGTVSGGRAEGPGRRPGLPHVWGTGMKRACSTPGCALFAIPGGHGGCEQHEGTTTQRGYGMPHQRARARLAATLPTPCGYCGRVLRQGDAWVAAHRVDGEPEHGWMVACPRCNEVNKRSRGGPSAMKRPPDVATSARRDEVVGRVVRCVEVDVIDCEGASVLRMTERPIHRSPAPVASMDARPDLLEEDDAASPRCMPARPTDGRLGRYDVVAGPVDGLGRDLRATLERAVSPLPHRVATAPASECPARLAAALDLAQVASRSREGADGRVSVAELPRVVTQSTVRWRGASPRILGSSTFACP